MEHASAGDDATCVTVLQDLIARPAAAPYVPAFLQAGQALVRLDRIPEAWRLLRQASTPRGRPATSTPRARCRGYWRVLSERAI